MPRHRGATLILGVDGQMAMDRVVERDQGLGTGDARYVLYLVVEKVHKVLVVTGKELDKHGVRTGGEMAFGDFGDAAQLRNYLAVQCAALEIDTDKSTRIETQILWVDIISRPGDNLKVNHALYALMYGGTRNAALHCDIL